MQFRVYELVDGGGNSEGVTIHAVFISRAAGEWLQTYINKYENLECEITPSSPVERSRSSKSLYWKIMLLFFKIGLLVLVMYVVLSRNTKSWEELKAFPSLIFTSPADEKGTSAICVVCREDYTRGDKLRLLPCDHSKFAVIISNMKWFFT